MNAAALLPALLDKAGLPPDPERELVRQVFPFSGVWRLWPQRGGPSLVYKEAWAPLDREDTALRYAASQGIPVPEVIASHHQDGRGAVLMTDLGQPARPATAADAAPLAVQIHRAPGTGLPVIDAAALAAMLPRIAVRAHKHGLSDETVNTAARLAGSARRLAAPAAIQPVGLCHSEWHPESVLIDAEGQPHAYDWARAFAGPALIDLSSWLGTREPPNPAALRVLIGDYVNAGGHIDALDIRAGLTPEAWALGWHRIWAADWYLQQLEMDWIPDEHVKVQREAIERHTAEAAELLRPW